MSELRSALLRVARALTDTDNPPPDDEYDDLVEEWARMCPHPGETDILFWPNELGLCREDEIESFRMSPEEMVEYAVSWEPSTVAMRVVARTGGRSSGYYLYELEAPGIPSTRVTTDLDTVYENGAVVAVALKGVRLPDGTRVETTHEHGVMSCGKILGRTTKPVGAYTSAPAQLRLKADFANALQW